MMITKVRKGIKTSEFFVVVFPVLMVFVLLLLGKIEVDQVQDLWPIFTGAASYAVSRGLAKVGGGSV